jgi:hypothetical protein
MNILIIKKGIKDIKRLSEVKWKLYSRKNKRTSLIFSVSGGILLALNYLVNKNEPTFWSLESTIASGLLVIGLFIFYQLQKGKSIFFEQLSALIKDPDNVKGEFKLELDKNSVTQSGPKFSITESWNSIKGYKEFENYIFLQKDKFNIDTIGLCKEDINQSEYDSLISFLKEKFDKNKGTPY